MKVNLCVTPNNYCIRILADDCNEIIYCMPPPRTQALQTAIFASLQETLQPAPQVSWWWVFDHMSRPVFCLICTISSKLNGQLDLAETRSSSCMRM